MQSVQHAYGSELLPGIAHALPSTAPAEYVQMDFTEYLNKMYTGMPVSSAPTTPKSTQGSSTSPWIWGTPDRRKRPMKETKAAPSEWFSSKQLLLEAKPQAQDMQFAG
eukprot:9297479-Karenia_brevis.AAC.1